MPQQWYRNEIYDILQYLQYRFSSVEFPIMNVIRKYKRHGNITWGAAWLRKLTNFLPTQKIITRPNMTSQPWWYAETYSMIVITHPMICRNTRWHVVSWSHVALKMARLENARHALGEHDLPKRHVTGCFYIPSGEFPRHDREVTRGCVFFFVRDALHSPRSGYTLVCIF